MTRLTALLTLAILSAPLSGCGSEGGSSGAASPPEAAAGSPGLGDPGGDAIPEVDESEALFDPANLAEFHLTLDDSAISSLRDEPLLYQSASLHYISGDTTLESTVLNVGIKLKGRASFRTIDEKPAFKIKFSEFVSGQRFMGMRRLTLNNMVQDPSAARERLGYRVLREAGIPSPRCNHAKVFINGEYFGLYANVETLDESFLERNFSQPEGNLYDTSNEEYFVDIVPEDLQWFELETNQATNATTDLENLAAVLGGPPETFNSGAATVLDLEEFLTLGATQAVLADWDGYFGASNNYKLYHDAVSDRFVLLPWGIDQTFNYIDGSYTMLNYNIDGTGSERPNGIVLSKCRQNDACYSNYLGKVSEIATLFDALNLQNDLDDILAQIEDALMEDSRQPHSANERERSVQAVREFINERGDIVRAQLAP